MYSSTRGRISGYAGHIPGLQHTLEVNNSEYSQFEFENRLSPTKAPRQPYGVNHYDTEQFDFHQPPVGSYQGEGAAIDYHSSRPRVMGYQGHVPGMINAYGVINSDYQNGEYVQRIVDEHQGIPQSRHSQRGTPAPRTPKTPNSRGGSRPMTPGERIAEQYRERAEQVHQIENTSRPQSRHRSVPNSRPATGYHDQPRTPSSRGGPGYPDQSRTPPSLGYPGSRNYQVEDYLGETRAISFAGYMPRKKFMIGI